MVELAAFHIENHHQIVFYQVIDFRWVEMAYAIKKKYKSNTQWKWIAELTMFHTEGHTTTDHAKIQQVIYDILIYELKWNTPFIKTITIQIYMRWKWMAERAKTAPHWGRWPYSRWPYRIPPSSRAPDPGCTRWCGCWVLSWQSPWESSQPGAVSPGGGDIGLNGIW